MPIKHIILMHTQQMHPDIMAGPAQPSVHVVDVVAR